MAAAQGIFFPGCSVLEQRVLGRLTATYSNREREAMQERQADLIAKNRAFANSLRAEALVLLELEHRSSQILSLEDFRRFFNVAYPLLYIAVSIHRFGKNKVIFYPKLFLTCWIM